MPKAHLFPAVRLQRTGCTVLALILLTVAGSGVGAAAAEKSDRGGTNGPDARSTAKVDATTAAVLECARLRTENFLSLPEAPATILSAGLVGAAGDTPEYCAVTGFVQPQIQFEIRLPTRTWNGRYLQAGCGGFCGYIGMRYCTDALAQDFVVAAENMGHIGDSLKDPLWGSDAELRRDYGRRSPHVVALVAKAIIERFYGVRPAYSYFRGCSTGGREALSEAQHYPNDFDGIIAGDPAFAGRLGGIANNWDARHLFTASGDHVISDAKIALLHRAVLKKCDAIDGLGDGIVSDPRDCDFKVSSLVCPRGQDRADCLTAAEAHAAQELYAGPHDSRGQRLYPGSAPLGSELEWYRWILPALAEGYLRYLAFQENPSPGYSLRDFDFDQDIVKLEAMVRIYDPVAPHEAPDLRGFQDRGGKLIVYQGWADPGVSPFNILDYYAQVTQRQGGIARVRDWFRLFMVPGMAHCRGGDVPDTFDLLAALVAWVEKNDAPDRVVATQLNAGQVVRSRPLFPYPTVARYSGSGHVNDAQSWAPVEPKALQDDEIKWIWSPAR